MEKDIWLWLFAVIGVASLFVIIFLMAGMAVCGAVG